MRKGLVSYFLVWVDLDVSLGLGVLVVAVGVARRVARTGMGLAAGVFAEWERLAVGVLETVGEALAVPVD